MYFIIPFSLDFHTWFMFWLQYLQNSVVLSFSNILFCKPRNVISYYVYYTFHVELAFCSNFSMCFLLQWDSLCIWTQVLFHVVRSIFICKNYGLLSLDFSVCMFHVDVLFSTWLYIQLSIIVQELFFYIPRKNFYFLCIYMLHVNCFLLIRCLLDLSCYVEAFLLRNFELFCFVAFFWYIFISRGVIFFDVNFIIFHFRAKICVPSMHSRYSFPLLANFYVGFLENWPCHGWKFILGRIHDTRQRRIDTWSSFSFCF